MFGAVVDLRVVHPGAVSLQGDHHPHFLPRQVHLDVPPLGPEDLSLRIGSLWRVCWCRLSCLFQSKRLFYLVLNLISVSTNNSTLPLLHQCLYVHLLPQHDVPDRVVGHIIRDLEELANQLDLLLLHLRCLNVVGAHQWSVLVDQPAPDVGLEQDVLDTPGALGDVVGEVPYCLVYVLVGIFDYLLYVHRNFHSKVANGFDEFDLLEGILGINGSIYSRDLGLLMSH